MCFRLNYVIGACAAGGVFGAWRRNPVHGLTMCLFFCRFLKFSIDFILIVSWF